MAINMTAFSSADNFRINQVGYYPQATKIAIVVDDSSSRFEVIPVGSNSLVFSGPLSRSRYWDKSDETVRQADFSELSDPGTYRLWTNGNGLSHTFVISTSALRKAAAASVKAFYVNAGITCGSLLGLHETIPDYFKDKTLNIPESGNGRSDLLDEIKFEIDWMKSMQDDDGGVFHKLTTAFFAGLVAPAKATA